MVVLVAGTVAATIFSTVSKGLSIKDKSIDRKICSVQTLSYSTLCPPRIEAVSIGQALTFAFFTGMLWGAPSLTAVILSIPESTSSRVKAQTIVMATLQYPSTVIVNVTVPISLHAHVLMILITAVGPAPAVHGQGIRLIHIDKYLLASHTRQWILQVGDIGHLAGSTTKTGNKSHIIVHYKFCTWLTN